jgi:hypothetical protein
MSKRPPYQWIADVGSVLLVGFVIAAYRFLPGRIPTWFFTLAYLVAAAVLAGALTELWLLIRDYRAGRLFPMRNASLFILLLTLVGLPLYLIYAAATGQNPGPSTLLLVPVMLTFAIRNLFRVRLDELSIRAKTGFRSPTEVPLFAVDDIGITDDRITIFREGKAAIQLLRVFFFPRHWTALRERLRSLQSTT